MSTGSLGLARFAFNIYGSLATNPHETLRPRSTEPGRSRSSKKLIYPCEKEITCLTHLRHPLGRNSSYYDTNARVPSHHVIIGGKNYLKLLVLNSDQSAVKSDINLVDPNPGFLGRLHSSLRLFNVNTLKSLSDLVACGLSSGSVNVFQVSSSGKSRLAYKFDDHKRVINSLDFVGQENLLLSGSQDGTIKLWDLRAYNQKPVLNLQASHHADPVRSCQYSPHSKQRGKMSVLTVHDSGALSKFDLRYHGNSLHQALPERKYTFHTGPALSLHIHPETEHVITGGRDRKICVWDYSDTSATSSTTPKYILNAYGPVMKVRWSETPNEPFDHHGSFSDSLSLAELSDLGELPNLALYKYDFACLYLNDDPTITVYNLRRKYIPSEIITTTTGKPIQNFIWANNTGGERRIWSITKSNVFVAYNLSASNDEFDENVCRPLQQLPKAGFDWNHGYADFAFTNQEQDEFDTAPTNDQPAEFFFDNSPDDNYRDDPLSSSVGTENAHPNFSYENYVPPSTSGSRMGSLPGSTPESFQPHHLLAQSKMSSISPQAPSFKDRPQLLRLATHNPIITPPLMSPSPGRQLRVSLLELSGSLPGPLSRPHLARQSSHSTQESSLSSVFLQPLASMPSMSQSNKKPLLLIPFASPYMVSVSLPLPLNDEAAFDVLAKEYHLCVPDGFTAVQTCQLNAGIAASVNQLRTHQVWNILATALEADEAHEEAKASQEELSKDDQPLEVLEDARDYNEEAKSILSELGNFVGSYNSNSTMNTNYGPGKQGQDIPQNQRSTELIAEELKGKSLSPPKHDFSANIEKNRQFLQEKTDETTGEQANAIDIKQDNTTSPIAAPENKLSESPKAQSLGSSAKSWGVFDLSQDADNENLHLMNNMAHSLSSSSVYGPPSRPRHSFLSMRASPYYQSGSSYGSSYNRFSGPGARGVPSQARESTHNILERVEERSVKSQQKQQSELTKAINKKDSEEQEKAAREQEVPWSFMNLLERALHYAIDQGDITMSSALISLFYGTAKGFKTRILNTEACLECLATYIDLLRRKELFSDAARVVKEAPAELKEKLSELVSKDINMRFYCCWCQKLLINERSKLRSFKDHAGDFGYWYCDECRRKQLNCIYCNEPCQGLTVVVSLKCGHRGHFGCLQDWFVVDQNSECPGGCEVNVI